MPLTPTAAPPSTPAPAAVRRLESLTGLRFVAAVLVVAYHFAQAPAAALGWPVLNVVRYGYAGVSFFFVLSGFLLAYVYVDAAAAPAGVPRRRFFVARFARVYPLYAVALVLALPGFLFGEPGPGGPAGLATAVTAPLLLQAWTPWTALRWNAPGWSLSAEAVLYLATPFLLAALVRRSGRGLAAVGAFAWALALVAPTLYLARWGAAAMPGTGSAAATWLSAVVYTPLLHVPQFALGLAVGVAYRRYGGRHRPRGGLALAVLGALGLGAALVPGLPTALVNNGLLAPVFAGLLWLLAPGAGHAARLFGTRPAVLLGEASYAVYLLQKPVHQYASTAARALGVADPLQSGPFFLLYLAALVGLSLAVYRWLEVPARGWLRRRLAGPEPGRDVRT